jgi:carbon storage regulator
MLVLSRKVGEEIVIPSLDIVLRVVDMRGDKVRIGITAPDDVVVHRQEVWERIRGFALGEPSLAATV